MEEFQKSQKTPTFKEKFTEGWKVFINQAAMWYADITGNVKKLIPVLIVTIIGVYAFIRGLIRMLFF